jgi:hypothetical protein
LVTLSFFFVQEKENLDNKTKGPSATSFGSQRNKNDKHTHTHTHTHTHLFGNVKGPQKQNKTKQTEKHYLLQVSERKLLIWWAAGCRNRCAIDRRPTKDQKNFTERNFTSTSFVDGCNDCNTSITPQDWRICCVWNSKRRVATGSDSCDILLEHISSGCSPS